MLLEPTGSVSASAQGMLSPTGRCHSFDVGADGFVRSEGCGVVLLKRLPDALRDGNRILAVVRGTAANQDGRSEMLTMPSSDAQVAVYRAALADAGVDPDTVGVVEAHGTGTSVGDPIEYREPGAGVWRRRQPLCARIGQEQPGTQRVRGGGGGADQGDSVAAARGGAADAALHRAAR